MPTSKQDFDILIAGSGFTGLTLVSALAFTFNSKLKIGLLDPNPDQYIKYQKSRAFAISATSVRMLDTLGLWHELSAQAQPINKIEITDTPLEAGVRPVLLNYSNKLRNGDPASFIVPSKALASLISENTRNLSNVEILPLKNCKDILLQTNNISLNFDIGLKLSAKLLLCAEGRESVLRQKMGIKSVDYIHKQTGIVTNITHERPHKGTAIQHFLPSGPFASLPLPGGNRSSITWSEEENHACRILNMRDEDFVKEVDIRLGGKWGAISIDGLRSGFPLKTQLARRFIAPRFALVGDTAHSVHPIAGQGLNLAFRDIAALCECLIDGKRIGLEISDSTILERYERWRRFDVACNANGFATLNRLFSNNSTFVRSFREFGLSFIDRLPGLKAYIVDEAAGLNGCLPKLMKGISI